MTLVRLAPDASALLTASAAAAGALVAIVGGFLISRLVALQSEKEGLERRLRQVTDRLELERDRLESLTSARAAVSLKWFEESALDDAIAMRGQANPEQLAEDHRRYGMTWEETLQAAADLIANVDAAFTAFESSRPDAPDIPDGQERIYAEVARSLDPSPYDFRSVVSAIQGNRDILYQRQDQRIRDENEAIANVAVMAAEHRMLTEEVNRVARPKGVFFAIGILAYFAAGSVIFPLVMLTLRPVTDSWRIRALVVFFFVSGFAALIGFLIWAAAQLRNPRRPPV